MYRRPYCLPLWLLLFATAAPRLAAAQEPSAATGSATVKYEQLVRAADTPENWLMYSGQYSGQRFSRLEQIDRSNVASLQMKWVHQVKTNSYFEVTPLVVNGMMYFTSPENGVTALDAATGQPYWTSSYVFPPDFKAKIWQINRGLGILDDTLFMGTLDGQLVALDAGSGRQRWKTQVGNEAEAYFVSSAPLIVKDMVVTGTGGGDWGVRGYLVAYDAKTGQQRWKTHTIPGPGEPHHESWSVDKKHPDAWRTGGAATWMTGSYDPELNLIYWGTGNPAPDYNGEVRVGDNLYSCCVLALDADSGQIRWHFQFTPHDIHDWDAARVPILADLPYEGRMRKLMLWANRNAFYYVLDRQTGDFLTAKAYAKQTWAERIDEQGRPVELPGKEPTVEGNLVFPDVTGASNWWSPSISPQTGLYYVMAFDGGAKYYIGEPVYQPGKAYLGTGATDNALGSFVEDPTYVSAVRALEATSGELKWEYRVEPKSTAGLLSTKGGLVFGGTVKGIFFALDAETGERLWYFNLGGMVHAAPISFVAGGKQYVTIAAGSSLFTFGL